MASAAGRSPARQRRRCRQVVRLDGRSLVCEYRTVSVPRASDILDFGKRIAQARSDADMTQAELGQAIGLDRTAIAKLESGRRKVSATELVAIAAALDRPIDWFVSESPPSVISRWTDASVGGHSRTLDLTVDRLARDVAFLVDQRVLVDIGTRPAVELPSDVAGAEALAAQARRLMGAPSRTAVRPATRG